MRIGWLVIVLILMTAIGMPTGSAGESDPAPAAKAAKRSAKATPSPPGAASQQRPTSEATKPAAIPLTMADTIAIGLRDNKTVRSAYIDRIAQKFDLRVAEDLFTPQASLSGSALRQRIGGINTTSLDVAPTVTTLLPTGATFGLAWANQMTNSAGILTRSSTANVSVTQPLLRGGGVDVTMAPVQTARLTERINQLKLTMTVSETIGQIILAFRALLQAQEELKLADASVGRAQSLVETNRALIAAGRMAQFDIIQTETDLETQRIQVLEAKKSQDTARLQLLSLLSLDLGTAIVAQESTEPAKVPTDLPRLMRLALTKRPDYLSQVAVVDQMKLGITVAENERLWDLSVFASGSFGRQSTSGIPGSARVADVTVGATFNIPLNDLSREQPAVHAATSLQTSELQLATIRQGLELQVRGSVMDIDISWQQLEVARRARDFAAKAVEIEQEKLKAGRSSNFQVRSLENDLRSAETQQLGATIGYLNALTLLDLQLGTTLDTWRITLKD